MSLVVDTSVIIAVITNELHKQKCIELKPDLEEITSVIREIRER